MMIDLLHAEAFLFMGHKEIWLPVKDYNGLYEISNCGNVRNSNKSVLKPWLLNSGYLALRLCNNGVKKTFTIHRLAAMTFIQIDESKPMVNHKDGVKTNNHIDNLEWCTKSENGKHAYNNKLSNAYWSNKRYGSHTRAKEVEQIDINTGNVLATFSCITEANYIVGGSISGISNVCNGKKSHAGGYKWRFKNGTVSH